MKLHSFTELSYSAGSIDEIYTFDGNFSKLEEFLEGTQYEYVDRLKSTAIIKNKNNGLEESIWAGTHLLKSFENRNVVFIYNGSIFTGYSRHLVKAPLKSDDPMYGVDVRGWTSDYNKVIDKNGNYRSVSRTELGEESTWKDRFDLIVLNKTAWVQFKENHHIELDDEKWKPTKTIAEY